MSLLTKSYVVTIQMKATKQYFLVVQFNTLYNVVLNYASVDKIKESDHSNCRLQAVALFSWSVEQNARDTQMTTRATEGARRERPLPRSRTRALPLPKLKKKSLLAVYSN